MVVVHSFNKSGECLEAGDDIATIRHLLHQLKCNHNNSYFFLNSVAIFSRKANFSILCHVQVGTLYVVYTYAVHAALKTVCDRLVFRTLLK